MLKDTDVGFLAGMVEGEGTMGYYYNSRTFAHTVSFSIANMSLELLKHLQDLHGGRIDTYAKGSRSYYQLHWSKQEDVARVLTLVLLAYAFS